MNTQSENVPYAQRYTLHAEGSFNPCPTRHDVPLFLQDFQLPTVLKSGDTHGGLDGERVARRRLEVERPVDSQKHLVRRVVHCPPEGARNAVLLRGVSRLDDVIHLQQKSVGSVTGEKTRGLSFSPF